MAEGFSGPAVGQCVRMIVAHSHRSRRDVVVASDCGACARGGRLGPRRGVGEGCRPPARPVALDRQAPPRERATKVGAETTAKLVWILAERLPEPEGDPQGEQTRAQLDEVGVRPGAVRLPTKGHDCAASPPPSPPSSSPPLAPRRAPSSPSIAAASPSSPRRVAGGDHPVGHPLGDTLPAPAASGPRCAGRRQRSRPRTRASPTSSRRPAGTWRWASSRTPAAASRPPRGGRPTGGLGPGRCSTSPRQAGRASGTSSRSGGAWWRSGSPARPSACRPRARAQCARPRRSPSGRPRTGALGGRGRPAGMAGLTVDAVASNGSLVVLAGDTGWDRPEIWTTTDGATWRREALPAAFKDAHFAGAAEVGTGFVLTGSTGGAQPKCCATGKSDTTPAAWASADGATWRPAAVEGASAAVGDQIGPDFVGSAGLVAWGGRIPRTAGRRPTGCAGAPRRSRRATPWSRGHRRHPDRRRLLRRRGPGGLLGVVRRRDLASTRRGWGSRPDAGLDGARAGTADAEFLFADGLGLAGQNGTTQFPLWFARAVTGP